jgi:hypothetical protein
MGDFGSATEAMRIIDRFALQIFAKKSGRCNFRLLQHYRHNSDMADPADDVRYLGRSGPAWLDFIFLDRIKPISRAFLFTDPT